MQPDPYHMDLHRLEHPRRLKRAALHRAVPPSPSRALLTLGTALIAVGEYVREKATQDARQTAAGRSATLTNELHKL